MTPTTWIFWSLIGLVISIIAIPVSGAFGFFSEKGWRNAAGIFGWFFFAAMSWAFGVSFIAGLLWFVLDKVKG